MDFEEKITEYKRLNGQKLISYEAEMQALFVEETFDKKHINITRFLFTHWGGTRQTGILLEKEEFKKICEKFA